MEHWGSDQAGVNRTRRFLLEWLSFTCRYVPLGLLERPAAAPQRMGDRPPPLAGRDDLETLMASGDVEDWVAISELLLGPVPDDFVFVPKHKAAQAPVALAGGGGGGGAAAAAAVGGKRQRQDGGDGGEGDGADEAEEDAEG